MISIKEWEFIISIIIFVIVGIIICIACLFQKKIKIAISLLTLAILVASTSFYIGMYKPTESYKNNNITKLSTLEEYKLVQTDGKYVINCKNRFPKVTYKTNDGYNTVSSNDKYVHYYVVLSEKEMRYEECVYKINDYSIFGKDLTTVGYEIYLTESVLKELGQEDYFRID